MPLFRTRSAAIFGIDAHLIDVEVDYNLQRRESLTIEVVSDSRPRNCAARLSRPGSSGHFMQICESGSAGLEMKLTGDCAA